MNLESINNVVVVVQSLSCVWPFVMPQTAAHQASPSFTTSWGLLKLMSIESVMPSNHLIFCHPVLLPPSILPKLGSFPMSQFFTSGDQSVGVSASASVLPMNIQDCFPLGMTAAAAAKWLQSCPTLCDPIDGSPPGSSIPGILQARTLEWVAMSFSNA